MLSDCNYDKVRLLHDLSRAAHFIKMHAINAAKKENHPLCAKMFEEILKNLDKDMDKLRAAITGLGKENKF